MHFLWLLLVAMVAAAPAVSVPDVDPWYDAPPDYAKAKPGTVLKIRPAPLKPRTVYFPITVKRAWQIMVRSEDSHGNALWTVTSLLEPFNADNHKLVLYQIAEDSLLYNCAPLYAIMYGGLMATILSQVEMFAVLTLLNQGYWVSTPDYEGQTAAFTAGRLAGKGVLDTIRGVLNSHNVTGIDPDPDIIAWGYLGGLLALGWAAALQPKYAPELKPRLKGVALGGFVTNITETVLAVDGGLFAGLIALGITGLASEYPQLEPIIKDELGKHYDEFALLRHMCMVPALYYWADNAILKPSSDTNFTYFQQGMKLFDNQQVQRVLADVTLGTHADEVPQVPLWVYHGQWDEIVPHVNTERVYDAWCRQGVPLFEFTTDLTGGHITDMFIGIPAAIGWIELRFGGAPVISGCGKNLTLSMLTHPLADPALSQVLKLLGLALFGGELGPNGENLTRADLHSLAKRGVLSEQTLLRVKRGDTGPSALGVRDTVGGWLAGL